MDRKTAIRRAKDRLRGSMKLTGLLSRFGTVRVFPSLDLTLSSQANEPTSRDYVTFTVEEVSAGKILFAEYQNVKEFA